MNFLLSILKEKCPYCYNSQVFEAKSGKLSLPIMKHKCSNCGRKLNGEPGYFLGAMYVSYAIAVAVGVATFVLINYLFPVESVGGQIAIILGAMLLVSFKNFKWSRLIWLKVFPPK